VSESKIGDERLKEIIRDAMNEPKPQKISVTCSAEQPKSWRDLQTKVKEIYSSLGYQVQENITVGGGKAKHQIDVLVTFEFGGQNYRIIIECKYWSSKVKKSQVSSLIGILADTGAEKGIIVSKMGFQRGAYSLATYTNIELLTYDELLQKAELFVERFRIQDGLGHILRRPFVKFLSSMVHSS
jgi:predicted Mrr-cat superfamily restriction endonuclease